MTLNIDDKMRQLLRDTASMNQIVAYAAQDEIAKALTLPLRQGILPGDIYSDIFERVATNGNTTLEMPLDFVAPGTEGEFVAYTIPNHGSIAHKVVQGDYVQIPTYYIGAAIDMDKSYAEDARWDVMGRALGDLRKQFTKKLNDDAWHTLLSAGFDRNIVVADTDAAQGQFTTRLVSLLKTVMTRNGGGNSSSVNRFSLTDLYVSVEAMEDMRSWNVDQIDETTRREIFTAPDGLINRIFSVNLHSLVELGEGQEYQLFWTSTLGATMPTTGAHTDVEIVVGLDKNAGHSSFLMPVKKELEIAPDNTLGRHRKVGWYGETSVGFAALDSRKILIGSLQ